MKIKLSVLRGLVLGLSTLPLLAVSANAECIVGNVDERLENFCILNEISGNLVDESTLGYFEDRLEKTATFLPYKSIPELPKTYHSFRLTPLFQYSDNLNGGNPDKELVVGDLVFVGDERYLAKEGLLVGGSLGVQGRYVYEKGRYLDYNLSHMYAQNPEFGFEVNTTTLNICQSSLWKDWTYLDVCASTQNVRKDLGSSTEASLSLAASRLFQIKTGIFGKATLGANRNFNDYFAQDFLVASFETTGASDVSGKVALSIGEEIPGELAKGYAASTTLTTQLNEKPLTLSLDYSYSRGGKFLGLDRNDVNFYTSISYPIYRGIYLSVGYNFTDSTIDYFDTASPTIGVQLAPLEF